MVHSHGHSLGLDITGITKAQSKEYFPDYAPTLKRLKGKGVKKLGLRVGFKFKIYRRKNTYELVLYHKGKVDKRIPKFRSLDSAKRWAKKYAHAPITFKKVGDGMWASGEFKD